MSWTCTLFGDSGTEIMNKSQMNQIYKKIKDSLINIWPNYELFPLQSCLQNVSTY